MGNGWVFEVIAEMGVSEDAIFVSVKENKSDS